MLDVGQLCYMWDSRASCETVATAVESLVTRRERKQVTRRPLCVGHTPSCLTIPLIRPQLVREGGYCTTTVGTGGRQLLTIFRYFSMGLLIRGNPATIKVR